MSTKANNINEAPVLTKNRASSFNRKGLLQKIGIPHHEHWPWWLLVAPFWPFWIWYGIRLRCATWFTVVNPGIEDGGFMGESKKAIQGIIPLDVQPKTFYISEDEPYEVIKPQIDLAYPYIAKPDIGGRGRKIAIIKNEEGLDNYNATVGEDYMLQDMVNSPLELGIFFAKIPNEPKGYVTSITSKGFLQVTGNGASTISQLMSVDERAQAHIDRVASFMDLNKIPEAQEIVLLEQIGNHSLGTKFINESHRINDTLHEVFSDIVSRIDGFYYGRFDLRVTNWDDLFEGKNISILELNGLTSDVTHIFDPNYRLRDVFKTNYKHIRIAYNIAKQNLKAGVRPTPLLELARKTFAALKLM